MEWRLETWGHDICGGSWKKVTRARREAVEDDVGMVV